MKLTTRRQVLWASLGLLAIVIALFYTNHESGRLELGGQFEGDGLSGIVTQIMPNEYRADLTTTGRRCASKVTVYGQRFENMIRFSPLAGEGGTKSECVIVAEWSEKGRIITLEEKNCDAWHGLACRYEGKMNRMGKPLPAASPKKTAK